jgi:hypothetical protein
LIYLIRGVNRYVEGILIQLCSALRDTAMAWRLCDTGVGIPATELPLLFERFHRVEGQRGRSHEGSGIGLALVQELVHPHGGTVTVESEIDNGRASPAPFERAHRRAAPGRGAQEVAAATETGLILLADDNADMRDYLLRLLSRQGWKVETAADGEAAVRAARLRRPVIVISDVMMPARQVRGLDQDDRPTRSASHLTMATALAVATR